VVAFSPPFQFDLNTHARRIPRSLLRGASIEGPRFSKPEPILSWNIPLKGRG